MSHEAFKSLLDAHASRSDRIAVLASPVDALTGIIDDSTICNAAYWEGVGPVSNTGQAYAALVDILDVLHGRATTGNVNLLNELYISSSGAVFDHDLTALGALYVSGQALLSNAMYVGGNSTFYGDLTVAAAKKLISSDGFLYLDEANCPSLVGQKRPIFGIDADDNVMVRIHDIEEINARNEMASGFSRAMNFGVSDGTYTPLYLSASGRLYLSKMLGVSGLPFLSSSQDQSPGVMVVNPQVAYGMAETGDISGEGSIKLHARWSGPEVFDYLNSSEIAFGYNTSDQGPYMKFKLANVAMANFFKGNAWFCGQAPDYAMKFHVASAINEVNYYMMQDPSMASPVSRVYVGGPSVIPGMQFGSGLGPTKTGRIGFDAYHAFSTFRIWLNNSSVAEIVPGVSLGAPLGDASTPIDVFCQLDSPQVSAVMANPRELNTSFTHLQGLFVGRGTGAAQLHNGSRVWLDDSAGTVALVCFGARSEKSYLYVKGGVQMTYPGSTLGYAEANNVGVNSVGAHKIPVLSTSESFNEVGGFAGLDAMLQEVAGISAELNGAACLVRSTSDSKTFLLIYDSSVSKWQAFKPAGALSAQ
jgi:hypothetical protein